MTVPLTGIVRDWSDSGQGIVKLSDGRVAFMPHAVVGDQILVDSICRQGKIWKINQGQILVPSPFRDQVSAPCPVFQRCGGCQLQFVPYDYTLEWKTRHIADLLQRVGGIEKSSDLVSPCIGMNLPWHFRGRIRYRFDPKSCHLAFEGNHSNELVPVQNCLIAPPALTRWKKVLEESLRNLSETAPESITLIDEVTFRQNRREDSFLAIVFYRKKPDKLVTEALGNAHDQFLSSLPSKECPPEVGTWVALKKSNDPFAYPDLLHLCGSKVLKENYHDLEMEFSPLAFSQTNLTMDLVLFDTALSFLKGLSPRRIVDLFCGCGAFTLQLAKAFPDASVLGVEIFASAIQDARRNAQLNHLEHNVDWMTGNANHCLDRLPKAMQSGIDCLVVDPPRAGLEANLCQKILEKSPPHLLYISCNPATLARDLQRLSPSYVIKKVQPVDLFPWSTHVETVVLLSRK